MNLDSLVSQANKYRFEDVDSVKAEKLLIQAAELGSGLAALELGVMYGIGLKSL